MCRAILVWNHTCDFKSNSRCALVRFWNHARMTSDQIALNLFKSPKNDQYQISPCHNRYRTQSLRLRRYALYGVRGVSQIKFTMSDSFLVFYDFDILSMIKRKNPFGFYCVILILNLSRLISSITILISKIWRVWFLKFDTFDFSNDTFDFQNLSRLISQITLLISEICRVWFLKWHLISKIYRVWFLKWHSSLISKISRFLLLNERLCFPSLLSMLSEMRFWLLIFSQSIS